MVRNDPDMPFPEDAPREKSAWESIGIASFKRKKQRREWVVESCGRHSSSKSFWAAVDKALEKTGKSLPEGFKKCRVDSQQ